MFRSKFTQAKPTAMLKIYKNHLPWHFHDLFPKKDIVISLRFPQKHGSHICVFQSHHDTNQHYLLLSLRLLVPIVKLSLVRLSLSNTQNNLHNLFMPISFVIIKRKLKTILWSFLVGFSTDFPSFMHFNVISNNKSSILRVLYQKNIIPIGRGLLKIFSLLKFCYLWKNI